MKAIQIKIITALGILAILSGCATAPVERKDYSEFRKANPRSVVVVPVVNRSVDVDAPDYFLSTIVRPIAERGYYVFPVNLTKRLMEDDGLSDADLVHNSDATRLASLFGADSVLYVSIERWDSKYAVFATVTTVELSYTLKSGITGRELWKNTQKLAYNPTEGQSQGGLAGLIAKAVVAAIEKAKPNYIPLARQVNATAMYGLGQGLPAGPLDSMHQKDQAQF